MRASLAMQQRSHERAARDRQKGYLYYRVMVLLTDVFFLDFV